MSVCQPVPVGLAEPVLDRDDREAVAEVGPEVDHPGRVERAALPLEPVDAVVESSLVAGSSAIATLSR